MLLNLEYFYHFVSRLSIIGVKKPSRFSHADLVSHSFAEFPHSDSFSVACSGLFGYITMFFADRLRCSFLSTVEASSFVLMPCCYGWSFCPVWDGGGEGRCPLLVPAPRGGTQSSTLKDYICRGVSETALTVWRLCSCPGLPSAYKRASGLVQRCFCIRRGR